MEWVWEIWGFKLEKHLKILWVRIKNKINKAKDFQTRTQKKNKHENSRINKNYQKEVEIKPNTSAITMNINGYIHQLKDEEF